MYCGKYIEEHRPDGTEQEQLNALWFSIGNQHSFHLTRASLCNLLRGVGFTSVYECLNPYEYFYPNGPYDRHTIFVNRATFVAIKGKNQRVISSPITQASPEVDRPENPDYFRALCPRTSVSVAFFLIMCAADACSSRLGGQAPRRATLLHFPLFEHLSWSP